MFGILFKEQILLSKRYFLCAISSIQFVLQNMDQAHKRSGLIGERLEKERTLFEQAANSAFFKAMVSASQWGSESKSNLR